MEDKDRKNVLANKRTDLAIQRTILANTRTFSAWIRTGLSSVLAGLAIVKFIGVTEAFQGYVLLIGILFVSIGIAIYILSLISYIKCFDELKQEGKRIAISLIFLIAITAGMILSAVLIMGLLIAY